jgi:hypothetical protein
MADRRINGLARELYGLTEEEIAIGEDAEIRASPSPSLRRPAAGRPTPGGDHSVVGGVVFSMSVLRLWIMPEKILTPGNLDKVV